MQHTRLDRKARRERADRPWILRQQKHILRKNKSQATFTVFIGCRKRAPIGFAVSALRRKVELQLPSDRARLIRAHRDIKQFLASNMGETVSANQFAAVPFRQLDNATL
ncbi:hypothetical protein DIE23_10195 [Burkholderia sp. Bp9143]|nr:hypothetical protein DIE23_10195 [Burkholderia sp. Bp9143]